MPSPNTTMPMDSLDGSARGDASESPTAVAPADELSPLDSPEAMMRAFEEQFAGLTDVYERLNAEVKRLNDEIDLKNHELEAKNQELEASLHEQQRLHHSLRSVVDSLHDGVIAVDLEGRIVLFNRRAAELTGRTEAQVDGQPYGRTFPRHPDILAETLRTALPRVHEFDDYPAEEEDASPRHMEVTTALVRDDNDALHGAVEVLRDMSERRQMEEQLHRANMLAALGEVAVTIAHEIRNPLGAIQLRTEVLRDGNLSDDERERAFDTIFSGIKLMDNTISNLLQFTRPVSANAEFENLAPVLDQALVFAEHAIRTDGVVVDRDYPPLGLMCHVDTGQFTKAMMNVIFNAVQATQGRPDPSVRVSAVRRDVEPSDPSTVEMFHGAPWIDVEVADNGCGIAQHMLKRVFTPFVTTKNDGVGLGLPIVHKIVEAHGGKMSLESTVNVGTRVRIMIPVYRPSAETGAPEHS